MTTIIRTNSENKDFKKLVELLNADLAKRDGENHPLSQFNSIENIKNVVLVYEDQKPIGCGAIQEYDLSIVEIKRVYVLPESRGKKVGKIIISELENWAKELGNSKCILVTGTNQPEANRLYIRNGYSSIPKYGKLIEFENILCFAKNI